MTCYLDLDSTKRYILTPFSYINKEEKYQQYATAQVVEVKLDNCETSLHMPVGGIKPEGLWYAFGQSWIDYKLVWDKLDSSYIFEISVDKSNIITLSNHLEIEDFNATYGVGIDGKVINWLEVSKKYDGIEIVPFDPNYSDLHWYQTFDVPSGCIWNLNSISDVKCVRATI